MENVGANIIRPCRSLKRIIKPIVGEAALGLPEDQTTYAENNTGAQCATGRISKQNGHEIHFPPS